MPESSSAPPRPEMETVNCPLCGADDAEHLFDARDMLHGLPGRFRVVECRSCGLWYLNPRPAQEALTDYYPEDYRAFRKIGKPRKRRLRHRAFDLVLQCYYGYPAGGGEKRPAPAGPLRRLLILPLWLWFKADRRNSVVIPFQGRGRFLDVGCGGGRMLSFMSDHGWDARGTEINPKAAELVRTRLGHDVFAGRLEDCPYRPGSFDVVLMSHVLEHLGDPVSSVRKVHELLCSGGRFYLRLPDAGGFAARKFKDKWFHLDAPRHLCSYTRRTVRMILEKNGFIVENIKQDRNAFGLQNTLRYVGRDEPSLVTRLAEWKRLMRFVDLIVALTGKGDAMIVRARKP